MEDLQGLVLARISHDSSKWQAGRPPHTGLGEKCALARNSHTPSTAACCAPCWLRSACFGLCAGCPHPTLRPQRHAPCRTCLAPDLRIRSAPEGRQIVAPGASPGNQFSYRVRPGGAGETSCCPVPRNDEVISFAPAGAGSPSISKPRVSPCRVYTSFLNEVRTKRFKANGTGLGRLGVATNSAKRLARSCRGDPSPCRVRRSPHWPV